ncbi:outer membrane beta-barrel protein [Ruficoccus amylovorans]|uniref:Outer membrane beta-barrel protein n=1 Tax=Ruficoccus amylovorans TaxID=1804625 RepID=A0A842HKU1_9BACT|nr:outer membrane beta-barrel protein [Ruficoccus amylovorans]MBC2596087.1 outer membrane beta-barrel protein [Ruficoccus amylovorans]
MKKQSTLSALIGVAALLAGGTSAQAAPLVTVADTVDVFFNGLVAGRFQTNVFNSPNTEDDFLFILGPGVEMNVGRNSMANLRVMFREDFYFYNRFDSLNTQRANLYIDGSYANGPLSTEAGFSYVQTQQNTQNTLIPGNLATQANLVKRDLYNAYANGQYDFSQKYWMAGGFAWNRVEYTNNATFGDAYSNYDSYSVPVDFFYRVTPKWSIGPGFRYRYTDTQGTSTQPARHYSDYFFNLALTGEVLPKLNAKLNIGYQLRDGSGVSNDGRFAMDSTFSYNYSEKLTLLLDIGKDFGVGGQGTSIDEIGVGVGARYAITPYVSAQADFDYYNTEYQNQTGAGTNAGREDNTYIAGASVTWTPDPIISLSLGYSYFKNDSNRAGLTYDNNIVNLQAVIRY